MSELRWDLPTRFLHFSLAATVTIQLFVSLIMARPRIGVTRSAIESYGFDIHEWVGLAALAVIVVHWLWSLRAASTARLEHLFPWNIQGRAQIMQELRALPRGQLPAGGPGGGLTGMVHGLGLLGASAMAITGGVLFASLSEHGEMSAFTHNVQDMHQFIATFVWIYWGGHVAMAVLHQYLGHDTLQRMSPLA